MVFPIDSLSTGRYIVNGDTDFLNKKHEILAAGSRLFYQNGFHNTGLSQILQACDITKPSLYYYYHSKVELGFAYLDHQENRIFSRYDKWMKSNSSLKGYLLTWWNLIDRQVRAGMFNGCPFSNFAGQMTGNDKAIFQDKLLAVERRWLRTLSDYLSSLKTQNKVKADANIRETAQEILVSFQGCVNLWKISHDDTYLKLLRKIFLDIAGRVDN